MDFQSAMETFAEAWVAANTKGATLGDVACAHQQAQGMALAMTSPGIPTSSAAASLSPPSSVARSPASPPPPPPPLSHPLKHSPPHPSATPPPTSATPPSTPVASESAAASQPLTRCGETTPSAEGQTIVGAALKEKSSAVGVGKSPSGKSIPVHCIVEAISVEVAPPRVPPPTSPTSSHHGTRTASSCPPSPPGHPPSSSTSPPPLSPSPNKRPASPTSQSSPPSTPKASRRGPPPPSVPSPPPSTPFSPPLIEMDSFAIIPASTPFRDILPVALQRLGYPRSTAAAARGSVVIRNWRPLSLERIPESPSASVAEVLGEISSFATLRIQVFRARSMSGRCSTPAATSPPPTAPSSASRHHHHSRAQQQAVAAAMGNGNSSVSPVSEMRDKLLRILLSHSHALLASSGCSIDEQGRQAASQSRIPLPPPPPPPPPSSQPQDYTSPSAEARRKFDGWYASLHPEHHHHHATSHHHHHSPQLQHHLMQQPPGVVPGSGGGGGRRTPTSPPPPPVSSAASPVTPAALLRHPAMHQHPHHHPMPHPGLHHSPYGAPPSVEMKQLLSPKLEALGLGDHVVHPALQTVQSQYPTQKTRMRTSFDPELELPKLQRWFSDNQHPSRHQIQLYVKELNSLESRRGRKPLDVNNVVYWFKNARAAQKRAELRHLNGYAAASSAAAAHHAAAAAAAAHHASSAATGSQEGEPYALMGAGRRKASTPGQRRPEDEDGGGAGGVDDEDDDGENGARRSGEGGSAKGDHGSFRSSSAASSSAPASPIPSYLVEVKQEPPEGSPAQSKPSDSMQHGEEMDDDEDDEDDEEDDDEEEEDEEHRRNGEGGREAPTEGNDSRRRPPEGRPEGGTVGEEDDEDEEDVEVEDGGEDDEDEAGRKRRISSEYAEAGEEDEAGQRQLVPRVGGLVDRLGFPLIPNSMFSHSIMYMSHYIPPGLQQAAMAAAAAAAASGGGENLPGGGPGGGGSASASPASMIPQGDERRKRNRTFIDPVTEVPRLEQWFSVNTHPSHNLILKYTEELNRMPYRQKFPRLEPKNVQFWFKNRRAKCKRLKMSLEQPGSAPYAYKTE